MRSLVILRHLHRLNIFKRTADPDYLRTTTKRKKYTGSYSDILALPSGGWTDLCPGTTIPFMLDYDPLT